MLTYLDTHAVIWLRSGQTDWLSAAGRAAMEKDDLAISPMVLVELAYLFEIGRLNQRPQQILESLLVSTGLRVCTLPFEIVARQAIEETWTRDVFDRTIVAQARIRNSRLITVDKTITARYAECLS